MASNYSAYNSTIAPLPISGVFTGGWEDTLNYSHLCISLETDVDGVLAVDFTNEPDRGAIHTETHKIKVKGGVNERVTFDIINRYFRIVYTNDGVAQATFKLYTSFKSSLNIKAFLGHHHNLSNNSTLNALSHTGTVNCMNMNKCTLTYSDTSILSVGGLHVEVSLDASEWFIMDTFTPTVDVLRRKWIEMFDLTGLKYFRLQNTSGVDNYANVRASLTGSN
jgi:hypothetical protein